MYAKLVNLITVFSKTGERCQNNKDVSANVKGMNYFFMSLNPLQIYFPHL